MRLEKRREAVIAFVTFAVVMVVVYVVVGWL
jgi:hypothetical protein